MHAPEVQAVVASRPETVQLPRFAVGFLIVDLLLAGLYVGYYLFGPPIGFLSSFVDLNGERNLPTWYASIQWFCVAAALWVAVRRLVDRSRTRSWLLLLLPASFLAFSLDEVAGIHEWIGDHADILLPNGTREGSLVPATGLLFLVVGVPFAILFVGLIGALREYLRRSPRAFARILAGTVLFLLGSVAVEGLANLVPPHTLASVIQVTIEELAEMVGGTIVLWGSWELVQDVIPSSAGR